MSHRNEGVRADHLGEIVQHLEGIVVLPRADLGNPDVEIVKVMYGTPSSDA